MSEKVKGTIGKLKEIKIPFMRKSAQGFIKQVKNANSAEEERILIANESASIRNDFGQSNTETLRENLLKLIFIHLLGYPSHPSSGLSELFREDGKYPDDQHGRI